MAENHEESSRLLDRATELAAGLSHGEAGLIGSRVCLTAGDPQDWLLGLVLTAFGTRVVCQCERAPDCEDRHQRLVRALAAHLTTSRPELALDPLNRRAEVGMVDDEHFRLEVVQLDRAAASDGRLFDVVIVLGALPADPDAALTRLLRLASMARLGGDVEVLAAPTETAARIAAVAGLHRLALRSRRTERLSLLRLADPLHEYPVEGRDHPQILAHCQARLDFAADYVAGADVLETGCGTGIGARMFLERGARQVVGIDRDESALELATRLTANPRARFQRWDLNEAPLPFADAAFDVVVCLEVLEHITAQETAVAEYLRVLRPGGRLIVSVPDDRCEDGWAELHGFRNPYHLHVPSREEFVAWLRGFDQVEMARQQDFIGTAVITDADALPAGEFVTRVPEAAGGMGMVRLAICTKAGSASRPATVRPRLQLYRNSSAAQLDAGRHAGILERQLRVERRTAWQALNLARKRREDDYRAALGYLFRTGGVIVCRSTPEPGRWCETAAEVVRSQPRDAGRPVRTGAACFELQIADEVPALAPFFEPEAQVEAVVFLVPRRQVSLLARRGLLRYHPREFWFLEKEGWSRVPAAAAFPPLYRLARFIRRTLSGQCWRHLAASQRRALFGAIEWSPADRRKGLAEWQRWVETDNARLRQEPRWPDGRLLQVLHYIGALNCGGAERQLANLAIGQKERGHPVQVLTSWPLEGDLGHYQGLLEAGSVSAQAARLRELASERHVLEGPLFGSIPDPLRGFVAALYSELIHERPHMLHCWMDHGNIVGAVAGLLAGVPRILLSFRDVNPTFFPCYHRPYMHAWYQVLMKSDRVSFLANSSAAAASYAAWAGIPQERIHVVANGIHPDHFPEPAAGEAAAARRAFGLGEGHRVVAGVFRLADKKQPELFLEVVRKTAERVPGLRVLLAGTGPLEDRVRSVVAQHHMGGYVRLLGRVADVRLVYQASDLLLLTSALESCPNAAIEAQFLGIPVVATDAEGMRQVVLHGTTGYLGGVHDANQLADFLTVILGDPDLRRRLGRAGREFARQSFDLDRMVERTLGLYRRMFTPDESAPESKPRGQLKPPAQLAFGTPAEPEALERTGLRQER